MAEFVLTERDDPIAVVLLNRPQQLNALSGALMDELVDSLQELDRDDDIRCIVLGGSQRAFAAGADITELAEGTPISLYQSRRIDRWDAIQPEIQLGVMPGAGGTQRLTRAVGKALAMDMILTGRMLTADEALRAGLVARVVAREAWLEEAKRAAREIAAKSPVSVRLATEAIDTAFEAPLSAGIEFERRAFYLARASEDADEGLKAFVEKRKPDFRGR